MTVNQIATSAIENGLEDFASTVLYGRMNELAKPFLDKFKDDGNGGIEESAYNEAMTSFISTLVMGSVMWGMAQFMNFFLERGSKIMGAMWLYIFHGKIKKKMYDKIKSSGDKGNKLFKKLSLFMGTDRTSDRIEIMKLAQSQIDSYDQHKFHYATQQLQAKSNVDSAINPMATLKANKDLKSVTLFTDLTFRGAWTSSAEHKKIYESATGQKLTLSGATSWSNLYQELNKYTEFHKTTNDEVINLTTILTKVLATKGAL